MTHSNSFVSSASPTMRVSSKMRAAFLTAMIVLFSAVMLQSGTASAQSTALIHHTVVKTHNGPPPAGRDFWFAMMSNYWGLDLGGKYMRIYITSANNCTAFVSSQYVGGVAGTTTPVPVTAFEISSFKIPEFWEMESSGIPENKAIHVYSNTADLTVYDMSHNPYTSDGSYIIPTIGWGTDYVVAAYGSLFEGSPGYGFDLPSTCVVVANQDNTTFEITPQCDCRQCTGGNDAGDAASRIVVYPNGQTQTFTLNRGQCMQFMPVDAQDPDNFDMTGTIIHSNQPVGVSGGSVCPNIPADFPYCDHVEEMIPPVRTWAETYYSSNPIQPPGETGKDFARYLFIASQPNQTIYRQDALTGVHTECVIANQYGIYWDELELGQKCSSNAPFLEVWYLNSATYPDGNNGLGDPAECVINPREQYTKTVVFETPLSVGNIVPYDDYANIIVNVKDAKNVLFDHKGILGYGAQPIDGQWELFNIPHIAPSVHEITNSDSGVGVYIYGYGYDESYAWAGSFGTGTFNSPDTIPPLVDTQGQCFAAFIHVSDSGLLPGGQKQSGLGEIRLDSQVNMNFQVDDDWIEGSGADTSGYAMNVIDPTKPAVLIVEVFDLAGNCDSITSVYAPAVDSIQPPLQNLGVWQLPNPPNIAFDTLFNTGNTVFDISTLQLLKGNVGFTIFDSTGGPLDLSPLKPGQRRLIMIKFQALIPAKAIDSIIFGNACFLQAVAVIGSGGAADFLVTSQDWANEPYPGGAGGDTETVKIENLSNIAITIDSAYWPDTHFMAVPGQIPLSVPKSPGSAPIKIIYTPTLSSLSSTDRTQGQWYSPEVVNPDGSKSVRTDSLIGNAITPSETFVESIDTTYDCVSVPDTATATFIITATGTSNSYIDSVIQSDPTDFFNLQGMVNGSNTLWNPKTQSQELTPGQTATISVQYVVPDSQNVTLVDHLTAINGTGEAIGDTALNITVHVIYTAGTTNPGTITFAPTQYQTPNPSNTRTFTIQNTTTTPLVIDTLSEQSLIAYNSAFTWTITTLGGISVPEPTSLNPDTIPPGGSLLVNVDFNDSLFNDPTQATLIQIGSSSCSGMQEKLSATVTHPGPNTFTYQPTAILSCDNSTGTAGILNDGALTYKPDTTNAYLKIVSIQWLNGGNHFTYDNTQYFPGYVLNGSTAVNGSNITVADTAYIPVTFNPTPQSAVQTFYDTLQITFVNMDGTTTTELIPVQGTAGGAVVSANAVIANQTNASDNTSGNVGNTMNLPIVASVAIPPALSSSVSVNQLSINSVVLTFTIPNQDLLTLTGKQFSGLNGWTLLNPGPNNPLVKTGANNSETITVTLTGGTLSQNATSFGYLIFQTDLSAAGSDTIPVTLQSMQLFTDANATTPVGACITDTVQSQDFSLITSCGDITLRAVMNGQGGNIQFIGSATPDPVTSGVVTMKYANLGASTMTLAIYDELGNEVARPVNNVYQDAGAWQVTTDVSKLPSGTYTYRLSGSSATGPMVLSSQFVIQR